MMATINGLFPLGSGIEWSWLHPTNARNLLCGRNLARRSSPYFQPWR